MDRIAMPLPAAAGERPALAAAANSDPEAIAALGALFQLRQCLASPHLPHGRYRLQLAAPGPSLTALPLVDRLPGNTKQAPEIGRRQAEALSMTRQAARTKPEGRVFVCRLLGLGTGTLQAFKRTLQFLDVLPQGCNSGAMLGRRLLQ